MGGVAAGDTVGYYVIAQDTSGNIRSNPAGVVATNVNTVTTPPTPNTYTILQTFSGTMSVGTGETLTSLTNNGGLFQALNAGVLTGSLTINITSDLSAETGTHSLNQLAEEGVGGYTIFFQSAGVARVIQGASPLGTGLITLNGADRVTFSGLSHGPGGLTFRNTGNAPTIRFINDATFDTVVSCVVEGGVLDLDSGVVLIGNGTTTGNDNISISDNTIRDRTDAAAVPANLIRNAGTPTVFNSNTIVLNNQLINFTQVGVFSTNTENLSISGNNISQTAARTSDLSGLVFQGTGTNTIAGNNIHDQNTNGGFTGMLLETNGTLTVSANRIFNIDNSGGNSFPWAGIQLVSLVPGSAITAVNNMVSLVPSSSTGLDLTGIFIDGLAGNFSVNHNSVLLGGPATGDSWAMRRNSTSASTVSMTNNIFFNDRSGSANHFAASDGAGGMGTWSSDHNLFVGTGSTAAGFFEYNGAAVDFTAWKTGPPARDANSIASVANSGPFNVGNMFSSANDLHLRTIGNNPAINAGTNAGVATDFDGQSRPFGPTPDIGADEVQTVPTAAETSISGRITTPDGRGIKNIRVVVSGGALSQAVFAITNAFGYFRVEGLRAGDTYVVAVSGKRYLFDPPARIVSLDDEAFGIDFVGELR
jgi:phage gp45-like